MFDCYTKNSSTMLSLKFKCGRVSSEKRETIVLDIDLELKVAKLESLVEDELSLCKNSVDLYLNDKILDENSPIQETEISAESEIDIVFKKSYESYLEAKRLVPEFKDMDYLVKDSGTSVKIREIILGYLNILEEETTMRDVRRVFRTESFANEMLAYSKTLATERCTILIKLLFAYKYFSFLNSFLARSSDSPICDIILDNITDDFKFEDAPDLLSDAISDDKFRLVKCLIDSGICLELRAGLEDATALMVASMNGRLEITKLLLDSGANVFTTDECGYGSLDHAIINGKDRVANELIKRGAIINIEFRNISYSNNEILKIMLKYGKYSADDLNWLLFQIIGNNSIKKFRILLSITNAKDLKYKGYPVLISCIKHGLIEFVEELLVRGFDVNVKCKDGYSAFYHALKKPDVLRLIFDSEQKITIDEDLFGYVQKTGNFDLLKHQDINVFYQNGRTALTSIKSDDYRDYIDYLLEMCDPNLETRDGLSPIEFAIENNMSYLFEGLLEHGAKIDIEKLNRKRIIAKVRDISILKILIESEIEIGLDNINNILCQLFLASEITLAHKILKTIDCKFPVDKRLYDHSLSKCDRVMINSLLDIDSNMSCY